MRSEKDGGRPAQQFEFVHPANETYIEQTVIKLCPRCNLHPAAIPMRIPHRNKKRRPPEFSVFCDDSHLNCSERDQRPQRCQQVSAVAFQPWWQTIRSRIGLGIHACAGDTAEERLSFRLRLSLLIAGVNRSEVDFAHISAAKAKLFPGLERNLLIAQAQGFGKIIAAAARNNQDRNFQFVELWKISVNSSISAEEQYGGAVRSLFQVLLDSNFSVCLEALYAFG